MARTVESRLRVTLLDGITGPAGKASAALARLRAASAGGVLGRIQTQQAALAGALAATSARGEALRSSFMSTGVAAAGFGLALYGPIKQARDFSRQLTSIQQKLNATPETMVRVRDHVRKLSDDLNLPINDVAKAFDEAVGKGLNPLDDPAALDTAAKVAKAYADRAENEKVQIIDAVNMVRALNMNLKISSAELLSAADALAEQGKQGAFELKDAAREMPQLSGIYSARGYTGRKNLINLGAMLQVATKTAPDAGVAANDVYNLLTKLDSQETRGKFKKLGIDIRKELKESLGKGEDLFEFLYATINKATKGDLGKVGDIWQDMQAQNAARALVLNIEEYRKFKKAGEEASNVIEKDLALRVKDAGNAIDDFRTAITNLSEALGEPLLQSAGSFARTMKPAIEGITAFVREHPRIVSSLATLTAGYIGLRLAMLGGAIAANAARGAMLRIGIAGLAASGAVVGLAGALARFGRIAVVGLGIGGISTAFAAIGAGALAALRPVNLLKGALWLLRRGGPIGLGIAALSTIVDGDKMSKLFDGIAEGFTSKLSPEAKAGLERLGDVFTRIKDAITPSADGMLSFGKAVGELASGALEGTLSILGRMASILESIGKAASAAGSAISGLWQRNAPTWLGGAGDAVSKQFKGAAPAAPLAGAKAEGGPVFGGKSYLVGERGPEIFTPREAGTIIPNGINGGGSASRGQINQTNHITVNAPKSDAKEIVRRVEQALSDTIRAAQRELFADTGLGWSDA